MKFILEVFHNGDCIDRKEFHKAAVLPEKGEQIYVSFENKELYYGSWWLVKKRKFLFPMQEENAQTVQLFCEPDPNQGA